METLKEIIASIGCDPYELLQTDPKEELAQLRKNYRILALKYHPDKNKEQSAKEMFLKINIAFEFLENEKNRLIYQNHIKALQEKRKREQNQDEQRRKFTQQLRRREQKYAQRQKDLEKELKRKKEFFEKKMKEQEERENLRNQIVDTMGSQQYYDEVSSVEVQWEKGFSFSEQLLEMALKPYGKIKYIKLESKRRKAKVTFNSIEECTSIVGTFSHPFIHIYFYLEQKKRDKMLRALEIQKNTAIDLTLNSQTISRFKQIINRSSTLYKPL